MANLFYVGVILELGGGLIGVGGKQLVSFGARFEEGSRGRLLIYVGLAITTFIGPILDASSYGFAPQSVIAPLSGLDVVWNTLLAPFTLNEQLKWQHVTGAFLVASGAALTSTFGPHETLDITLDMFDMPHFQIKFLAYSLGFCFWLTVSGYLLCKRPAGVGDRIRGFLLATTAGSIAGNMIFVSCFMSLLRMSIADDDWTPWTSWQPWFILLCAACVALSNIPFMTKGLKEYEAISMVTLFVGSNIAIACFSGALLLGELEHIDTLFYVLYWLSFLLILAGLYVIYLGSVRPITKKDQSLRSSRGFLNIIRLTFDTCRRSVVIWAGMGSSGAVHGEEPVMEDVATHDEKSQHVLVGALGV